MYWDHELSCGCSAGVLACECTGRLAGCSCWRRDAAATRSRDGCATRFMESLLGLATVHWDHEPLAVPGRKAPINRTHSKRFAHADESADHAVAFVVRASSAPLSQGTLQFDGRAGSWKARGAWRVYSTVPAPPSPRQTFRARIQGLRASARPRFGSGCAPCLSGRPDRKSR